MSNFKFLVLLTLTGLGVYYKDYIKDFFSTKRKTLIPAPLENIMSSLEIESLKGRPLPFSFYQNVATKRNLGIDYALRIYKLNPMTYAEGYEIYEKDPAIGPFGSFLNFANYATSII